MKQIKIISGHDKKKVEDLANKFLQEVKNGAIDVSTTTQYIPNSTKVLIILTIKYFKV